jgi:hypothetical protein
MLRTIRVLVCDRAECLGRFECVDGENLAEVRQRASAEGWETVREEWLLRDVCPDH